MENEEKDFALFIDEWLRNTVQADPEIIDRLKMFVLLGATLVLAIICWIITYYFFIKIIEKMVRKSETKWDDALLENRTFHKLAHIVPLAIINIMIPYIFEDYPNLQPIISKLTAVLVTWIIIRLVFAFISSSRSIFSSSEKYRDKPIASYTQLAKLLVGFIGAIIMLSILLGRNPIYLFSALGAVSAVLILVFKDTILGFIASIQLSINDMVRLGDWVSVPKYGADGDVIEINLTTIKVRNWDYTFSTVPTYFFVSDSFTNWRGMQESGGRRIKRAIRVKQSSIKFCNEELLDRFARYQLIRDYINTKRTEITAYNAVNKVDTTSLVNGRNLTNIGVFRKYITEYIKHNPNVNQDMVYMVRQLEASDKGLPIEIYCFSKVKEWVMYENIQADIFDHIFAVVNKFDLEVFENPTGADFRASFQSK